MIRYSLILLFFILLGCSGLKTGDERNYQKGIVYVLPHTVLSLLGNQFSDDEQNVHFVLYAAKDEFTIYKTNHNEEDEWIKNTNRYISVRGKLYPLLFGTDYDFANTENAAQFLVDQEAGIYLRTQTAAIFDSVYHVTFTKKGEILYEGYNGY